MEIRTEQRESGVHAESAHEAGMYRVAIVTHKPDHGGTLTKVWFGDCAGRWRYDLIADINMETGEVSLGKRLDTPQ